MHRILSSSLIGLTAILALGSAAAQATLPPPVIGQQQTPAGVDVIMSYAGTWKIHGERFATAHSDVGKEETTLRNDCWKSGAYVACNQYVDGDSKILLVFTYDPGQKMYTSYQVPQDGSPVGSGKLQIVGNVWTFPWTVTHGDATTYFHVVNVFTTPDRLEYVQEFSTDNVHWTTMAKGFETRMAK